MAQHFCRCVLWDRPRSTLIKVRVPYSLRNTFYLKATESRYWKWVKECPQPQLNQLPLDKMAAILADDIFICIFGNRNDRIPIQMSLKYVTITWTNDDPIHWRIYSAPGGRWVRMPKPHENMLGCLMECTKQHFFKPFQTILRIFVTASAITLFVST